MTVTVGQLIEEQAARLVGRGDERAILHEVLGADGPLVIFVHGLAGVGKSTLVQAFAVETRERGATVLRLDCRAIEPTERGFLAALAGATGGDLSTAADAADRLERLGQQVVLILDTYEVFRLFDAWLQQRFMPLLSPSVRVVLSGREPPMTGWESALGNLFRSLSLGGLSADDAATLLRQAGIGRANDERIDRFARGPPLSLKLAASALRNRPDVSIEAVTVQAIVQELTELYLDVLDPATRRALDAAAVVRRPTQSLLAAMLPDAAPQDAFDRLLGLAFLEAWWRREPGAFRVMRDRSGAVAGFHVLAELDRLSHALLESDPVARRCWEHLRRDPVPPGQRVLINRRWLARDHGESPSPVQAACWLDVKGRFMELRPNLRRIYTIVRDFPTLGPMVAPLGFAVLPGEPTPLDGSPYYAGILDFGPSSIDGWLSTLIAAELRIDDDSILDVAQHQLVLGDRRVDLTNLEFDLFNYLFQRPGQVVRRASLLHDVWGTDYAGGSNVIEVAVGSI